MVLPNFTQRIQIIGESTRNTVNNPGHFVIKEESLDRRLQVAIANDKLVTAKLIGMVIPSKFTGLNSMSSIINIDTTWDHNVPTIRNGVKINSLGYIDTGLIEDFKTQSLVDSEITVNFSIGSQVGTPTEFRMDGTSDMKSFEITLNTGENNTPLVFENKIKKITALFAISIY